MRCLAAEWRALPPLARSGALIVLIGGVADLAAHVLGGPVDPRLRFTFVQYSAHLVILLGMVLTMFGVIVDAMLPLSRDPQSAKQRRFLNALR